MDPDDLVAREELLTGHLEAVLSRWEATTFVLGLDDAVERPGAPISLTWTDGPTRAAVEAALLPSWTTSQQPSDHSYPVTLQRRYSLVSSAAAILMLHADHLLTETSASGRAPFNSAVEAALTSVELPRGLPTDLRARAELLTEIAETLVGRDPFSWACWLTYGGGSHVLTQTIPATLGDTANR